MGVVVYQAIYDHEVSTPADRRTALRGVVFVSLAMDAQLAALAGKVPAYLDLCVVDADPLATRRQRRRPRRLRCRADRPGPRAALRLRRPAVGPAGDGAAAGRARGARPQRRVLRRRRAALGGDARRRAADHHRPDATDRERGARAHRRPARRGRRAPRRRGGAARERAALSQHPRQRADRHHLFRPERPRDPGQPAVLRADRLQRGRAGGPAADRAHPSRGRRQRRGADRAAGARRDPDAPPAQALPHPSRRGGLGAGDGDPAARLGQPALAHRRRGRGHHRAPPAGGGGAGARGGGSVESGEERVPVADEP